MRFYPDPSMTSSGEPSDGYHRATRTPSSPSRREAWFDFTLRPIAAYLIL